MSGRRDVHHLAMLSNANSGGNRRGLERVNAVAAELGIRHVVTQSVGETEAALRSLAESDVDVLAINGGDGTIQATLSVLRSQSIFAHEPAFALLRSGTTNMIHRDVGVRGRPHLALRRLAALCSGAIPRHSVVSRRVIALQHDGSNHIACGFFFGAAAIPRAICLARARLHPRGLTGPVGEGLALAWLMVRLLAARVESDPVLRPESIGYALDGGIWRQAPIVLLMVTTLDRMILGLRPLGKTRALGLLALSSPYRRLWQALPALLAGRFTPASNPAILLADAQEIALRAEGDYVLDGEIFASDPASPVTLRVAQPAQFLKL